MPQPPSPAPPLRILIAGAGNYLLAADRVGPRVLELLQETPIPHVELVELSTAPLALLDVLDSQDLVIIVDACINSGAPPGSVQVSTPSPDPKVIRDASVHQLGPLETLAVAQMLFPETLPHRVLVVSAETGGVADSEVEAIARTAASRVLELIKNPL